MIHISVVILQVGLGLESSRKKSNLNWIWFEFDLIWFEFERNLKFDFDLNLKFWKFIGISLGHDKFFAKASSFTEIKSPLPGSLRNEHGTTCQAFVAFYFFFVLFTYVKFRFKSKFQIQIKSKFQIKFQIKWAQFDLILIWFWVLKLESLKSWFQP